MHSVSFYSFAFLLVFLVFTTTNVLGNDFRYPSRDVMKAMLRDPKAYFRGEPIRFVTFSSYLDSAENYTNNMKPMVNPQGIHSRAQNMLLLYPSKSFWALEGANNEAKNLKNTLFSKNKRSEITNTVTGDNDITFPGRNIRSPLGTMRFGKRDLIQDVPNNYDDMNNWILYYKRSERPSPLGTMRFGK
uniref:COesterase domain-containing protein n=1 Tax=Parastrongyloides trichosuri TaxID=131310 RepID=A0A0N4ZIV1_PARTI